MTTEEAKLQIEYRKDFATPAQIEALDMAKNALDKIEKYRKAIKGIKTEITSTECAYSFSTRPDSSAFSCGLELAFEIVSKHTEGLFE